MNRGSLSDPGKSLDAYSASANTGSSGVAVFENLAPDHYYFVARVIRVNDTLKGHTSVTITESFNINRRELLLQVQ